MSIFGNIFNKSTKNENKVSESKPLVNWIPLTSITQIEEIKKASNNNYVGIFKHSTRCVISRTVLKQFEAALSDSIKDAITFYYLDLLNYREVSNEIGYEFQVMHQSPQFLLIKNETAILNASHYDILQINLEKNLK